MKKICVVSSTRADYGLLYWPIKELISNGFEVSLVATGTHLSKKHGYTVDVLKTDGMPISAEIDIEINGDRPKDIGHVMAVAVEKFSAYFASHRPDALLILGDRFEIFAVTQTAMIFNIPIIHIHGGEVTEGAIDDSIRHAITKMASLHFTTTETYRKRVIQLGENPANVFCVGAPGLDNIKKLTLLSKEELAKNLSCKFSEKNILITFHPVTVSESQTIEESENFFGALAMLPEDISFFITLPNADAFSESILKCIEKFRLSHADRTFVYTSLGQLRYLSLMKQIDAVAGNSSSGIIEAPFMGKAVVNVGDRQKGRATSAHVIHVGSSKQEIFQGLILAVSKEYQEKIKDLPNIYGNGNSGAQIAKHMLTVNFTKLLPKKFYDL